MSADREPDERPRLTCFGPAPTFNAQRTRTAGPTGGFLRFFRPTQFLACAFLAVTAPAALKAQASAPPVDSSQMAAFARAHAAITQTRDQVQAELAAPKNKKTEDQATLREKLKVAIAGILAREKVAREEFDRLTFLVASDSAFRRRFEGALAQVAAPKPTVPPST